MMFGNALRVTVVLAATAALAQSSHPGNTPAVKQQGQTEPRGPAGETATDPLGVGVVRDQVDSMEGTLSRMHTVLKQMRGRGDEGNTSDSASKVDVQMWELMVGHLDNELQDLKQTLAAREDMERRRAALYKQADAKIAAASQAARAAQAARFVEAKKNATGTVTPTTSAGQRTGQGEQTISATPAASEPSSMVQPTNKPASPN